MAGWIGLGGLAFTVGNLVLAGALSREDFGRLALFQAFVGMTVGLAPLGLDNLVVRRELRVAPTNLRLAVAGSVIVAVIGGAVSGTFFGFEPSAVALLLVAITSAAVARMCAASEQAAMRLTRSQLVTQLPNLCFCGGGLLMAASGFDEWRGGAAALSGGFFLAALFGTAVINWGTQPWAAPNAPRDLDRNSWGKALLFVSLLASVLVLHHLEKLVIPSALGLADLATFAVVVAVVRSPYRILQSGIVYSLIPRIKAECSLTGRTRLVKAELALAAVLGLVGGAVLAGIAQPVIRWFYGDKYQVGLLLVIAVILVGVIRLFYAVAAAVIIALGDARELRHFNTLGWVATVLAILGAVAFSVYGLVGVIAGASLGWLVRLAGASVLARPAFALSALEAYQEGVLETLQPD